jgi:hypothetical protein
MRIVYLCIVLVPKFVYRLDCEKCFVCVIRDFSSILAFQDQGRRLAVSWWLGSIFQHLYASESGEVTSVDRKVSTDLSARRSKTCSLTISRSGYKADDFPAHSGCKSDTQTPTATMVSSLTGTSSKRDNTCARAQSQGRVSTRYKRRPVLDAMVSAL